MQNPLAGGASSRVSRRIHAPPAAIYEAFLDPGALVEWLLPDSMRGQIHAFDLRAGCGFRMSLTYEQPEHSLPGKTSENTDTVQVRFVELIPFEKIVEIAGFESEDPAFAGEMKMIITFEAAGNATDITYVCEDIPRGIRPEDNEEGTRQSLRKLAAYVERRGQPARQAAERHMTGRRAQTRGLILTSRELFHGWALRCHPSQSADEETIVAPR